MILNVYALRDQVSQTFLAPTLNTNDASACRELAIGISQSQASPLGFRPGDFDLYCLGTMDMSTGALVASSPVRLVSNAQSLVMSNG